MDVQHQRVRRRAISRREEEPALDAASLGAGEADRLRCGQALPGQQIPVDVGQAALLPGPLSRMREEKEIARAGNTAAGDDERFGAIIILGKDAVIAVLDRRGAELGSLPGIGRHLLGVAPCHPALVGRVTGKGKRRRDATTAIRHDDHDLAPVAGPDGGRISRLGVHVVGDVVARRAVDIGGEIDQAAVGDTNHPDAGVGGPVIAQIVAEEGDLLPGGRPGQRLDRQVAGQLPRLADPLPLLVGLQAGDVDVSHRGAIGVGLAGREVGDGRAVRGPAGFGHAVCRGGELTPGYRF